MSVLASCSREDRILRQPLSANDTLNTIQISGLNPGANLIPTPPSSNMYEESAYAVSEGQKLYDAYNCVGCHAHGGGGIGPPLMDRKLDLWQRTGKYLRNNHAGKAERDAVVPKSYPRISSLGNRCLCPDLWLACYRRECLPNRTDQMNIKPAESSTPEQIPTGITGVPEQPK